MRSFAFRSPFGLPLLPEDFDSAIVELARLGRFADLSRRLASSDRAYERDRALMEASGRWVAGQPEPPIFAPGDAAAIRLVASDKMTLRCVVTPDDDATRIWYARTTRHLGPLRDSILADFAAATPYFIAATAASPVLSSRPPSPEFVAGLRLPFERVFVLFGNDLSVSNEDHPWPGLLRTGITSPQAQRADEFSLIKQVVRHGCYLTGIVLHADADGQLADDLLWVVATDPAPSAAPAPRAPGSGQSVPQYRTRGVLLGFRHSATLKPLVDILAATVACASWRSPGPPRELPDPSSRKEWRKLKRHNQFHRQEERGVLASVHIIDLGRSAAQAQPTKHPDGQASSPSRQSPISHDRCGHFRRVRVGPRTSWEHEYRWIPPVRVNGRDDPAAESRLVVRRIPPSLSEVDRPPTLSSGPNTDRQAVRAVPSPTRGLPDQHADTRRPTLADLLADPPTTTAPKSRNRPDEPDLETSIDLD